MSLFCFTFSASWRNLFSKRINLESTQGPANSTISRYYYYYEQKPLTLARFRDAYGCFSYGEYPTPMDGVNGWSCEIW